MPKLIDLPDALEHRRTFGFFDDFDWYISPHRWTSLAADAGTSVAVGDAAAGRAALTTGATDNNEAEVKTTNELFLFAADKPLVFECRLQYAEANTDDANVMAGVMDAVGANALLDDGGGPKASYSGAVFFKVDGGTVWQCETSIAGTQTTTELTAANALDHTAKTAGGASYQTLRIEFVPVSTTQADVRFFIDGVLVARHLFTFTNATEMQAFVAVKAGGANSEVVTVDYVACYQLR